MIKKTKTLFDRHIGKKVRSHAIQILRVSLGIVFLWFGALKIIGESPVAYLIENTCFFLPFPLSIIAIGIWESLIGICLIFKIFLRSVIVSLWAQMFGIFFCTIFNPALFFNGNPFLLTLEGEFVVKNFVFIAAGIVLAGYKTHPVINT